MTKPKVVFLSLGFVTSALASSAGAAPARPTPAAAAARKALDSIEKSDLDPQMRGMIARTELAEDVYGLPAGTRRYLQAVAGAAEADRAVLLAGLLDDQAHDFLQKSCGSTDLRALVRLSVEALVKQCHLKEHKAAPSHLAATLLPMSLLVSGYVNDAFTSRGANEAELRLARWAAHADRKDAGAKQINEP